MTDDPILRTARNFAKGQSITLNSFKNICDRFGFDIEKKAMFEMTEDLRSKVKQILERKK